MQDYYLPKLQMQIPGDDANEASSLSTLFGFLKNNFSFPSDNLNEIILFVNGDAELKRIIYNLPELISSEFPNSPVILDFMKYAIPEEKVLKIIVKTKDDSEESINKESMLKDKLIDEYVCKSEFFIRVEA